MANYFKAGNSYWHEAQITNIEVQTNGDVWVYYSGRDYFKAHLGSSAAAAITALNTLITGTSPYDFTSTLI
jgi:hypothetical protein